MTYDGSPYALDIETTGLKIVDDKLIGLSICNAAQIESAVWYPAKSVPKILQWLSEYQIPIICWNALFDIGKLTHDYPEYPLNLVCDVAVMAQMADNSNATPGFGLKPSIRKYFGYETVESEIIDFLISIGIKADEDNFREHLSLVPEEMVAKYCKYDAYYTYALFEYLPNFIKVDTENWMYLYLQEVWATIEARIVGFRYNKESLLLARDRYTQVLSEVENEFLVNPTMRKYTEFFLRHKHYTEQMKRFEKSKTGKIKNKSFEEWKNSEKNAFNIGSNTQLIGTFQEQGLYFDWESGEFDYPEYTEKGAPTLDANHIGLYGEGGGILERRGNLKMLIDKIGNILGETESDGRWHPDFNLLGTKSGRISSSGANILAFPFNEFELAGCILSDKGHSFIAVDFRSLEPAVQAHLSGDPKLRYAISEGVGKKPFWQNGTLWIDDIYLLNISEQENFRTHLDVDCDLWLVDSEVVKKKNKLIRNTAKGVYLSTGYGAQPPKVRKLVIKHTKKPWKLKEIKPIVKGFWATFTHLLILKQGLEKEVREKGYFVTEFGFPLTYRSTAGQALATPMHTCLNRMSQSTAAGVMKLFIAIVLENKPDWMIFTIPDLHDACTVQVPDDLIEEGKQYIMTCLDKLNETLNWEFPLMLSMTIGKSLYETKN